MSFVIDSNIKPPDGNKFKTKYPFNEMRVGDSFFAPEDGGKNRVRWAAHQYGKTHGIKFATRKEPGGMRVWRIE